MHQADAILIELPAKYENLLIIRTFLGAVMEKAPSRDDLADHIYNVQLATHEICLNIIQHAYGHEEGRLQVYTQLDVDNSVITIDIYDSGKAFDLKAISLPDPEEPQAHGYGLFIAKQLMDRLEYTAVPGKNHWRLQKQF